MPKMSWVIKKKKKKKMDYDGYISTHSFAVWGLSRVTVFSFFPSLNAVIKRTIVIVWVSHKAHGSMCKRNIGPGW